MKFDIANNLTKTFSKVKFKAVKHSPEIMVVTGVVGVVASGVMACKATTKASAVTEQMKQDMAQIDEAYAVCSKLPETDENYYSEADKVNDTKIVYTQTGISFVKLYAPSVIVGGLSIASIWFGHNILRKRNVALAAAYTAIDTSFKAYRGRVVERFGEELDRELKYNIKAKEYDEIEVNEKGKEKVTKHTVNVIDDPNGYSEYARFYDDGCTGWTKDPESNLSFLKLQMSHANDKLQRNGYLYLNDVYDLLGIPRTKAGQVVGWIYDEKHPIGDNFVDFGIYDTNREVVRNFVNGYERTILLDFNVDGNIWDKM